MTLTITLNRRLNRSLAICLTQVRGRVRSVQTVKEEGSLLQSDISFDVGQDLRPSTKWYREQPELHHNDSEAAPQVAAAAEAVHLEAAMGVDEPNFMHTGDTYEGAWWKWHEALRLGRLEMPTRECRKTW